MALFDSDTENEDEFECFQEEWQRWVCSTSEATLSFDWRCYISTARGSRSIPLLWASVGRRNVETACYGNKPLCRAREKKEPPLPKSSKWMPVDVDTMKVFIGLCLAMGIIRLPSRHNYWRQNKFMFVTSFNNIMSRDRFDLIWRYLHLHDNKTPEVAGQHDKLKKIRWLVPWLFEQEISI
jgi:hypothetical protein